MVSGRHTRPPLGRKQSLLPAPVEPRGYHLGAILDLQRARSSRSIPNNSRYRSRAASSLQESTAEEILDSTSNRRNGQPSIASRGKEVDEQELVRVQHGYGNTRGVSETGTAGTGMVCTLAHRSIPHTRTAVSQVCMGILY